MLISDNLPVRKCYIDSNIIARILRRFFLRIILKWTSIEAHVYMRRHQDAKVQHFDASNVIYHTFSNGAVSYRLNGENINIMLESVTKPFACNLLRGNSTLILTLIYCFTLMTHTKKRKNIKI